MTEFSAVPAWNPEMDRYINSLETHQATADAVRAWYAGRPADSDFERNVQLILAEEGIALDRRHLALAAAAVSMYGRHLQVQAEQSRPSSYVGEKLGRLLTIQRIVVVHNIFRHADDHLILFRDQDGNQVKWKTSAATREMLDGVGKTMEATFKVKEHGDYKGVAQTTVTHLKALRWVDSEAEGRNSLVDTAVQDVATVESVRSAIADVVRLDLQELGEGVGRVVVSTSADLQRAHFTRWFDGSCVADESGGSR